MRHADSGGKNDGEDLHGQSGYGEHPVHRKCYGTGSCSPWYFRQPMDGHSVQASSNRHVKGASYNQFFLDQSAWMMKRNCSMAKLRGNSTTEKRNAVEAVLTFTAPSPEKVAGVPSIRDCVRVLGVPKSTLIQLEKHLIEKRQQLSTGKKGIYWARVKCKKGFCKINKAIQLMLIGAFNNHPHVIMSPNSKDTLQLKNAHCWEM